MRCEARLAALTLFLSLGNASWLPQATPWAVNQVDDWGWTPKPTAAPDVRDRLPRYRLRRDSASFSLSSVADLSTVCGYEGTRPFICAASSSTSYYCATAASALDCCPLGVNSSLVECAVTSVCYNSAESAASCAVNGCNAATGVWYVSCLAGPRTSLTQPEQQYRPRLSSMCHLPTGDILFLLVRFLGNCHGSISFPIHSDFLGCRVIVSAGNNTGRANIVFYKHVNFAICRRSKSDEFGGAESKSYVFPDKPRRRDRWGSDWGSGRSRTYCGYYRIHHLQNPPEESGSFV
jgi:hypothetical protein